jgi:uncharacterized delta-60 repeat protein
MRTMAATAWWLGWLVLVVLVLSLPGLAGAAPGRLDPTFGPAGKTTTNVGPSGSAFALAVQPDGKIVVAGTTAKRSASGAATSHFALARYHPDGHLDPAFGTGGKVVTDFGDDQSSVASALALQADGKIVVGGGAGNGTINYFGLAHFALARYHPNGSLDLTFGVGGKVTTDFGGGRGQHGRRA